MKSRSVAGIPTDLPPEWFDGVDDSLSLRPDYVCCIRDNQPVPVHSLCGRYVLLTEFTFLSADHVRNTVAFGSRLEPCPACWAKAAAGEPPPRNPTFTDTSDPPRA